MGLGGIILKIKLPNSLSFNFFWDVDINVEQVQSFWWVELLVVLILIPRTQIET
jgi:hypothetical protein